MYAGRSVWHYLTKMEQRDENLREEQIFPPCNKTKALWLNWLYGMTKSGHTCGTQGPYSQHFIFFATYE
jgi:hypothetical protein